MANDRFVWDDNKHDSNIRKHGVSFIEAITVFDDPNACYFTDEEHSGDEDRFVVIGLSNFLRALVVCHCYRSENVIRIISARKATKKETQLYGGAQE